MIVINFVPTTLGKRVSNTVTGTRPNQNDVVRVVASLDDDTLGDFVRCTCSCSCTD